MKGRAQNLLEKICFGANLLGPKTEAPRAARGPQPHFRAAFARTRPPGTPCTRSPMGADAAAPPQSQWLPGLVASTFFSPCSRCTASSARETQLNYFDCGTGEQRCTLCLADAGAGGNVLQVRGSARIGPAALPGRRPGPWAGDRARVRPPGPPFAPRPDRRSLKPYLPNTRRSAAPPTTTSSRSPTSRASRTWAASRPT